MHENYDQKATLNAIGAKVLFGLLLLFSSRQVFSASCWEPTNIPTYGQMSLTQADCTTIPDGYAWLQVLNPIDSREVFLKIPLNDPHVSDSVFYLYLTLNNFFITVSQVGEVIEQPVITTSAISPCGPACGGGQHYLYPWPPEQGIPTSGNRVRLRHQSTENCLYGSTQNGDVVQNEYCWYREPEMTYILTYAGVNTYRLQQETSNQCIYSNNSSGSTAHHWGCWNDLNMRFRLDPANGGYRLRHVSSGQCLYNANDSVSSWSCWNDPNMVYHVDIID